ncbi:hypothetical protein [Herbaspirillum sp. ST 5-3]|uniref:hypothetical protein n=1 Tax=Oxalobacteraceae TaxID=75682 RepID=UPI0010A35280|nr:hypothetical protein [Herbaspirillum sp. ST 5-3]
MNELKTKVVGDALKIRSASITKIIRDNKIYLITLIEVYKENRLKPGYSGSVYKLISDALAYRGIYKRSGEKIGAEELTTIFARLRKE